MLPSDAVDNDRSVVRDEGAAKNGEQRAFAAPFSPAKVQISPRSNVKLTSFRARTPGNDFAMFWSSSSGATMMGTVSALRHSGRVFPDVLGIDDEGGHVHPAGDLLAGQQPQSRVHAAGTFGYGLLADGGGHVAGLDL